MSSVRGDRQIGVVTSATRSPALGRPIAIGYVHRDFAEPSTAVVVSSGRTAAGGRDVAAVRRGRIDGPEATSLRLCAVTP